MQLVVNPDRSISCSEPSISFDAVANVVKALSKEVGRSVVLHHDGVWCTINGISDLGALSRAFTRGKAAKGPTIFGPNMLPTPSSEELLSDRSLDAVQEFTLTVLQRVAIWNEIGQQPRFKVDPKAPWPKLVRRCLTARTTGRYGPAEVAAAWRIGCLIQARVKRGNSVLKCLTDSLSEANFECVDTQLIIGLLLENWHWEYRKPLRLLYPR